MKKIVLKVFVVGLLLLFGASAGFAEDMRATVAAAPAGEMDHAAMKGMDPSTMTEEQKAMQARMQEYTTPNANHEVLKSFVGSWKANVKMWMDPKATPEESEGTSEAKMIMGGRFLEQTFNGTFMGGPFEGRGIYGYDNMRQEYTGLWFDSMATGIMVSAAKHNAETKVMTEEGSMSCPISGEGHRWYKAVTTIIDADHYTYESFLKDKDGQEFRSMLISYSRAQ